MLEHNICFNETLGLGEDLIFYLDVLRTIDAALVSEKQTYIINEVQGSATRRYNPIMEQFTLNFAKHLLSYDDIVNDDKMFEVACYQINQHVNVAIELYFLHPHNPSSFWERIIALRNFLGDENISIAYKKLMVSEKDIKHKAKYWLLAHKMAIVYLLILYFIKIKI